MLPALLIKHLQFRPVGHILQVVCGVLTKACYKITVCSRGMMAALQVVSHSFSLKFLFFII